MTTPPTKLYGLDHLRALAILQVFLFHYFILSGGEPAWLPDAAKFGWTGVDLFFVLSGFLIASPLLKQLKQGEPLSLRNFFIKRFFRILPAFWVVLALYFCIPFFREKEALPPLWKFLCFTQNFGLNLQEYGTFSHAWSLCVEEHFYLLLPFTLLLLQRSTLLKRAGWLLIALFITGFFIRHYSFNTLYLPHEAAQNSWMYWYKYVYYPTYNRLDGLLVGVSIAAIARFAPQVWHRLCQYPTVTFIASLGILTGAYFLCAEPRSYAASVWGFPLIALGYGVMLISAVSPGSFLYRWRSPLTAWMATLSYALYLSHKGVIHITHELWADAKLNPNLLLIVAMVTCGMAAYLLHLVVEKPFMKWRNRFLKPEKKLVPPPVLMAQDAPALQQPVP